MELNISATVNEISEKELEKQIKKFIRNINYIGSLQDYKILIIAENQSRAIKKALQK